MSEGLAVITAPATLHIETGGDTTLWIQPRSDNNGARTVLTFTTADGMHLALALSRDELVNLHEAASNILAADDAVIDSWLDQAAAQLLHANHEVVGQ